MSVSPDQDKNLLVKAIECKSKQKINIEQFLTILHTDPTFTNINERGLYLQYVSELLLKAFLSFGVRMNGFIGQLEQRQAKKRKKRQGGGGYEGGARRKKKNNKKEGKRAPLIENRNIQDLSNESLSNPSNIQRPRINEGQNRADDNSNPASSKQPKGDESQDSKESGQNNLKIQLNKITEQIRGHQQTYISDGMHEFQGITIEDNSQTNSSGRMSGQITDIHEKLKIISVEKGIGRSGATTRRKTRPRNTGISTKTKRKNYFIADETTILDETRATQLDFSLNQSIISEIENKQLFDLHENFLSNIREFNDSAQKPEAKLFNSEHIKFMRDFMNLQRENSPGEFNPIRDEDQEFMQMNDTELPYPDYTMSQPITAPMFSQDLLKEAFDMNENEFTLDQLAEKTGKQKPNVFYQMLWRAQNDEITMEQESPETFSQIFIRQN